MIGLGDLKKLLGEGHLKNEYTYSSENGDFKFAIKTLTPLEEALAHRDAEMFFTQDNIKRDSDRSSYIAVEILSYAIESVNNVPLEKMTEAVGETDVEKRRFFIKSFGPGLLIELWKFYNTLQDKILIKNTKEEDEAVKK